MCSTIAPCSVPRDHSVFCAPGSLRVLCPTIAWCSVPRDHSVFCAPRSLGVLCPGIAPCSVPQDRSVFCAPRLLRVLCPGIALCSVPRNRSMFYAPGLLSCSGLQAAEGKQCLFLFPDLCSFYVKLIVENPFFPGASELLSTRYKDKEEIFLFPRLGTAGATC